MVFLSLKGLERASSREKYVKFNVNLITRWVVDTLGQRHQVFPKLL